MYIYFIIIKKHEKIQNIIVFQEKNKAVLNFYSKK